MAGLRLVVGALVLSLAQVPLVAQRAADQFLNVKLMVNTGDKPVQTDAILRLEDDRVVIRAKQGAAELKSFLKGDVKSAEYSYSKSPRWKSGAAVALAAGVFAIPIFFMKGKQHWLTINSENDYAVLRLDKSNYKIILPAFEARTGVHVETLAEEK